MSDYILLILAILLMILGIVGCLVPMLPGPPFSFFGILMLHFSKFGNFSSTELFTFGAITVGVTIMDYIVPRLGARKLGGSKYGIRGATVGLAIGIFLGPLGIILGPLIGAFIGEMIFKDQFGYAIKAGLGSLIGFMAGIGLKLAASFVMIFYFVKELMR